MNHTWTTNGPQTAETYAMGSTDPVDQRWYITWHCDHCGTDFTSPIVYDSDGTGWYLIDPPEGAEMPFGRWKKMPRPGSGPQEWRIDMVENSGYESQFTEMTINGGISHAGTVMAPKMQTPNADEQGTRRMLMRSDVGSHEPSYVYMVAVFHPDGAMTWEFPTGAEVQL